MALLVNGIYRHYKKGHLYRVVDLAYSSDNGEVIVIYYSCDENGIFQSIRVDVPLSDNNKDGFIMIGQPFYRKLEEFTEKIQVDNNHGVANLVNRFELIKEL